jgi:carbonic anhydrase
LPFSASSADESANAVQRSWSYEGVTGPEHWSELSPDYASCQFGVAQSPIDLVDSIKLSSPNTLVLDYRPVTAHVALDSLNLKVVLDPGCQITLYEQSYVLEGFRFCRPSEHLLSGRALEMELQFMHRARNGDLTMVAVFVRQGATNKALDTILANLPVKSAGTDAATVFPLNPLDVLPQMKDKPELRSFYNYAGSLSSPPCTEGIRWVGFKNPVEASPKQIRDFAAHFPRNARPVNKINARILLEYGGESASVIP